MAHVKPAWFRFALSVGTIAALWCAAGDVARAQSGTGAAEATGAGPQEGDPTWMRLRRRPKLQRYDADVWGEGEAAAEGDAGGAAPSFLDRPSLTDHFFGLGRPAEGIAFDAVYTGEVFGNYRGGIRQRLEYLDNLDLQLTLESAPLVGFEGGTLFLYALGNSGGDPSRQNIGDAQVVSNIEAGNTFQLFEAWYEQRIGEAFSLRAGLYDLNTEFDANEVGSLFINSSHGIGPEFSASGENGPSVFPYSSLVLRGEVKIGGGLALRGAVFDGVSGDPGEFRRTQVSVQRDDGVLAVGEVDLSSSCCGIDWRIAVGAWRYSRPFDDVLDVDAAGNPDRRRGNTGAYVLVESTLYREVADGPQGLGAFVRWGVADDRFNLIAQYLGAGVVYTGLLPHRDDDQFGVAVGAAFSGSDSRRAARNAGESLLGAEVNLEITYRVQVAGWLAIQPDVQVIINPGFLPRVDSTVAAGIRFEITL